MTMTEDMETDRRNPVPAIGCGRSERAKGGSWRWSKGSVPGRRRCFDWRDRPGVDIGLEDAVVASITDSVGPRDNPTQYGCRRSGPRPEPSARSTYWGS